MLTLIRRGWYNMSVLSNSELIYIFSQYILNHLLFFTEKRKADLKSQKLFS
jgi:hypothetical protein